MIKEKEEALMKEVEKGLYGVESFDEIKYQLQDYFTENKITTLYKIRNWREKYHPEFLSNGEIYFTRPNELNDPFDIHKPFKFDISVIETTIFFKKLVDYAIEVKGVMPGRDAEIIAKKQLNEIRENPTNFFLTNYMGMVNSKRYNNSYGVFSVTTNINDEQLWAYYGGGLKGFAVGFNPIALCEELFSSCNPVNYSEEIFVSKIIDIGLKEHLDVFFHKYPKWDFESEYRFFRAFREGDQSRRIHIYKPATVTEIILGLRTPDEDEEAILGVVNNRYPHAKVSRMKCDYSNGNFYHE